MSISIPASLARFLELYRSEHGLPTKSRAVERALEGLRAEELKKAYAAAAAEVDEAWETTSCDGLVGEG